MIKRLKTQQKYKARHDRHRTKADFQVGDLVWLHLGKRLKGEGKKLKPIRYGSFKIIRKIGDNACQLELPQYMEMYSVVNVENLKSFEPSMLDDESEENLPSVEDLVISSETKLLKDTILEKKTTETRKGVRVAYRLGKKDHKPSLSKWYSREKAEAEFPHLQF